MPLMFNTLLTEAGLSLKEVHLLRHKDNRAKKGRSPYELWRDDLAQFELYQSTQKIADRKKFNVPYWAVFVVNFNHETLFAGLYSVKYKGLLDKDLQMPQSDGVQKAGSCDFYEVRLLPQLMDFKGKLIINWGPAALAWVQYPARRNKEIIELRREFKEPDFPGFLNFILPLSKLDTLPESWITTLKSSAGIYLLTCPKTKEQYIGSASGSEGFWGRWRNYIKSGHGGNIGLKSRDPSDYQVSILEVAGSSIQLDELIKMEGKWQTKLQSREMGLNRNLASQHKVNY